MLPSSCNRRRIINEIVGERIADLFEIESLLLDIIDTKKSRNTRQGKKFGKFSKEDEEFNTVEIVISRSEKGSNNGSTLLSRPLTCSVNQRFIQFDKVRSDISTIDRFLIYQRRWFFPGYSHGEKTITILPRYSRQMSRRMETCLLPAGLTNRSDAICVPRFYSKFDSRKWRLRMKHGDEEASWNRVQKADSRMR